jgi:glucose/arabinose dehydrogenase
VNRLACLFALLLPAAAFAADPPKPTVVAEGIKNIRAVCVTPDGRTFVTQGRAEKEAGAVLEVKDGKATKLAETDDLPWQVVPFQQWLFVKQPGKISRVNTATGKSEVWVAAADLPNPDHTPDHIWSMAVDERGALSVLAHTSGQPMGLYTVGVKSGGPGKPTTRGAIKRVADWDGVPNHCLQEGMNHLLMVRQLPSKGEKFSGEEVVRVGLADGKAEAVAELAGQQTGGMCTDPHGRLYLVTSHGVWGIPRPGEKAVKLADRTVGMTSVAYHPVTRQLLIGDQEEGKLLAIPAVVPGWEVDESPLPVAAVPAFADVKWTGWDDGSASGKANQFRPIVLTHANDGSGRTFVATQHGVIHTIDKGANESKVFLDIQSKVLYKDTENEQGLLGLAFHPDYKKNGEFFVFYTDKSKKLENVVCRFKVSKDDPNKADPASEQELLRVSHKYWNHDGGTLAFGPDGFLYVVLGDGGSGGDPDDHGQKTDVLLGKILRIDVTAKGDTTPYAIPKDNPFVGKQGYRPEIFALGVRNPWRLSFDRKTGQGWFGEVGQNLWEEVNLLEKGANYGWRRRESLHPFGADGVGPSKEFTDPIWEYHHDVGKSITGGHVYRGKEVPALDAHYLYADYVSTKVWALKYDDKAKRVTANRPVAAPKLAWMSFGEDEAGEVYLMTYSASGKGIYKFKPAK